MGGHPLREAPDGAGGSSPVLAGEVDARRLHSGERQRQGEAPLGKLYIDGKLQGAIEKWDLRFEWDPSKVLLVLGAAYVGHMDDLAVFDRPLTDGEVDRLFRLKEGVRELYPEEVRLREQRVQLET